MGWVARLPRRSDSDSARAAVVLAGLLALVAEPACFDGPAGLPCGPALACPTGMACAQGVCSAGTPIDADGADRDAARCGDDDDDGVCDADDTWPCGPLPAPTPNEVQVRLMSDQVVIGTSELVALPPVTVAGPRAFVVGPSDALVLQVSYLIGDCACVGCIEQLEFGLEPGGKQGCLYNANPGTCAEPTTGRTSMLITAPVAPGRYDLRIGLGQSFTCPTGSSWWQNPPPPESSTIAHLCVR